jgi:phosphopantothenoylcysteine decarboxylase/phosphopantothenate--cysteine ligase
MSSPVKDKRILLGVTGSIACYKAADLASKLTQAGALVDTVFTQSAIQFVNPLTFQSVTGRQAFTDADLWGSEGHVRHIDLGHNADLVMIAPATANTIAKLAHGLADNLLTLSVLAASSPILVAPAMDGGMYTNSATQANISLLSERGYEIVGPAAGHLASGMTGTGRMIEPLELVGHARRILGKSGPLSGRKVIVSAGGTREPIDPVRSITNRSSGKQGFALAQAAIDQGGEVILVTGSTHLTTPIGAKRVEAETAEDMLEAIFVEIRDADALIMAAAVADFKPASQSEHKIKKTDGIPEIKLQPAVDILANIAEYRQSSNWDGVVVGFAAESTDLITNARAKLKSKRLDLIAANDISAADAGFNAETNRVTLLFPDGRSDPLPLMGKDAVADMIIEIVARILGNG